MNIQRFTPQFKVKAVRQSIDRKYLVAEVSARLGVSAHSLYKWVKAVAPDKTEKEAGDLLAAKSELLRLRAQLRRTEEERDILKKGPAVLCSGARVKYRFINDYKNKYPIKVMCRILLVGPGGFQNWVHNRCRIGYGRPTTAYCDSRFICGYWWRIWVATRLWQFA